MTRISFSVIRGLKIDHQITYILELFGPEKHEKPIFLPVNYLLHSKVKQLIDINSNRIRVHVEN